MDFNYTALPQIQKFDVVHPVILIDFFYYFLN